MSLRIIKTNPNALCPDFPLPSAFEEFIANHTDLTSRQLQFLDLLKGFLIERGELTKRDLIQSPFTMLHPEGIRGVFKPKEIDEIIKFTERLLAA